MPLEARGSELEQPFAFGVVRQLLEPVVNRDSGHADLFAGAAGPAARLFEPGERRPLGADVGFEALHSLYWLVVNIADQAPRARAGGRLPVGRPGLAAVPGLPGPAHRGASGSDAAHRPPAGPCGGRGGVVVGTLASRPSAVALYPRPLSRVGGGGLARERLGRRRPRSSAARVMPPPVVTRFSCGSCCGPSTPRGSRRRRPRRAKCRRWDRPRSAVLSCTGWPRSAPRRSSWRGGRGTR